MLPTRSFAETEGHFNQRLSEQHWKKSYEDEPNRNYKFLPESITTPMRDSADTPVQHRQTSIIFHEARPSRKPQVADPSFRSRRVEQVIRHGGKVLRGDSPGTVLEHVTLVFRTEARQTRFCVKVSPCAAICPSVPAIKTKSFANGYYLSEIRSGEDRNRISAMDQLRLILQR